MEKNKSNNRKDREGHKWVYYKLSWKGESLLHPENTKIVVLFATTFIALWAGIIQMIWYVRGRMTDIGSDIYYSQKSGAGSPSTEDGVNSIPERLFLDGGSESTCALYQDPMFLYIAIACFIIFTIVLSISLGEYEGDFVLWTENLKKELPHFWSSLTTRDKRLFIQCLLSLWLFTIITDVMVNLKAL